MHILLKKWGIIPGLSILLLILATSCGPKGIESTESITSSYWPVELDQTKIGAFNLLRLGQNEKDLDRMAELVADAKFHIFAAVEIMNKDSAKELLYAIERATGNNWSVVISKESSGESSYREFFAFYYQPKYVRQLGYDDHYCSQIEDDRAREKDKRASRWNSACYALDENSGGKPDFERDPFVGHFNIGGHKVSLVSVHLIYGKSDATGLKRRQRELQNLKKVMADVRKKSPGSAVLSLGDYNLYLKSQSRPGTTAALKGMDKSIFSQSPQLRGLIDGPTTVGSSNFDHFLMFAGSLLELVPGSEKIHTDFSIDSKSGKQIFKSEVSDHYPISAKFSFKGS